MKNRSTLPVAGPRRLSTALLACLCLPAGAQETPPPAAPAASAPSGQNPAPSQTVDLRERRPFSLNEPPELKWGPVAFHPRLSTLALYDDNILVTSQNPQSDLIIEVAPAVAAVAGGVSAAAAKEMTAPQLLRHASDTWPGLLLVADYGPKQVLFTQHDENNTLDHAAFLNAVWPKNPLVLGLTFSYDLLNTTILDARVRTQVETYKTAFTTGYKISSKTSVELNLQQQTTTYAVENLYGYRNWSAPAWLNFKSSDRLVLGAGVTPGYVEVFGSDSQTYERLLARAQYFVGQRLDFELAAGGEARQFDSGADGLLEPYASLALKYRPLDRTTLFATGSRETSSSATYGYTYTSSILSLGGRQALGDAFGVSLAGFLVNNDYQPSVLSQTTGRSDDYFAIRAGCDYRFAKYSTVNIYYQFNHITSTAYPGYDNNQIGLRVTLGL